MTQKATDDSLATSSRISDPSAAPDAELAALERALAHLKEGRISEAQVQLAPFEGGSRHPVVLSVLARMRMTQGDFEQAQGLLKRAETLSPFDRMVWETLADLLAVQRRHIEEVAYRRKLAYTDAQPPPRAHLWLVRAFVAAAQQGMTVPIGELRLASRKMAQAPGLKADLQLQFAEQLYPVKKLAAEARSHYAKASPCLAGEQDVSARWTDLRAWCEESGSPCHDLQGDDAEEGEPPLWLAELSQVMLFPHFQWIPILAEGQVVLNGFTLSRLRTRREYGSSPLLMQNSRTLELRLPKAVQMIETPALLIGSGAQYYHHTIEFASRLSIAEALGLGRDLPIVVNADLAPFQREHLALLGYPPERLIGVNPERPMCFRHLMVPSVLSTGGQWIHPRVARWYRERLAHPVALPEKKAGRRLYLSRRRQQRRRLLNEPALGDMLAALGFETICPEELSVREQIEVFSGATHIVAPTGAALTNMVYAPPGARVVSLQSRYMAVAGGDLYFDALARACQHSFAAVVGEVGSGHEQRRAIDADFSVSLDEVRATLD